MTLDPVTGAVVFLVAFVVLGYAGCVLIIFGAMTLTPPRGLPRKPSDWIGGILLFIVGGALLAFLIPFLITVTEATVNGIA